MPSMLPKPLRRFLQPTFPGRFPFLGINFLVGDIQTGIMPLLAVDLAYSLHWKAGRVGEVLAFGNLALLLAQPLGGMVADRIREKRFIFLFASTLFALGCFALPGHPSLIRVLLAQGLIGVSTAVMIPVLSAMAMGLAGKERFPHVMGLAQGANHTGSVAGALIVGFLARHWNPDAVFLFYGISAFLGGLMALLIPRGSIDPLLSREARPDGHILSMGTLLKAPVLLFFLTIFLFFVANTAMLPLAGEKLANRLPEPPGEVIAWAIVVTQAIMTALSLLTPILLRMAGSRPIFLLCLLLLPARGFFLSVAQTQREILEIQILDGIATGILSVLLPVLVSDIARGSGRFNAMIGLMGAMISAGGFLSQILAGHLAEFAGIDRTFLVLSTIAGIAFILGAAGAGRARIAPPDPPLEPVATPEA